MNRNLSFEQRLHNAEGAQTVEQYKAIHAYLHGNGYDHEEFDLLWYHSDNTTWGHGFGRMIGFDEIYYDQSWNNERSHSTDSLRWQTLFPELIGHDLRSVARSGAHALGSDVIEIAEDGMSARSYYLTPGVLVGSIGFGDQRRGNVYMWERYGSEFIFVNGEWKWFHEQVCPDIWGNYDIGDWAHDNFTNLLADIPEHGVDKIKPPKLTDDRSIHGMFSMVNPVQRTVVPPAPYDTLSEENTISPGYAAITPEKKRS